MASSSRRKVQLRQSAVCIRCDDSTCTLLQRFFGRERAHRWPDSTAAAMAGPHWGSMCGFRATGGLAVSAPPTCGPAAASANAGRGRRKKASGSVVLVSRQSRAGVSQRSGGPPFKFALAAGRWRTRIQVLGGVYSCRAVSWRTLCREAPSRGQRNGRLGGALLRA